MDKRGGQEVIDYFYLNAEYRIEDDDITDVASFRKAMQEGDECRIVSSDGDKTVVEVSLELYPIHKPDPPTLECMKTHMDGAHCGLGDWYPEIEEGIAAALAKGPEYDWTTGWYASKKEIASAKIDHCEGGMRVEVSVSDDFDTPGMGCQIIQHTTDLERIREAIYEAWSEAEGDQKDNREYVGWSLLHQEEYTDYQGRTFKHWAWMETYIQRAGDALEHCFEGDQPPGDNYHKWGFQEDWPEEDCHSAIPEDVRDVFEQYIHGKHGNVPMVEYKGWRLRSWDDSERH